MSAFMKSDEIHALVDWPATLAQLGVPANALRNKHGPCPACGGENRFRFDNKQGRGTWFCNQCGDAGGHGPGAGTGFDLLMRVKGWTYPEARKRVIEAAGLGAITPARRAAAAVQAAAVKVAPIERVLPPERVLRLRRERRAIESCADAVDYLASRRHLWPLPPGCTLHAHPSVEYWVKETDVWKLIGRFPALVADVVDIAGELVAGHLTFLHEGKKLAVPSPRKLWGKPTGWTGCAVRLMPAGDVLGIAEGIETALSAAVLHGVPVWAAINKDLLAKFEPPPGVLRLLVFADRDKEGQGQRAAETLKKHLEGRVQIEIRLPPEPAKDFNDVLVARNSRTSGQGNSNG